MGRRGSSAQQSTAVAVTVVLVAVVATGVAVAATFSLTSKHLGAGQVTTPLLFPDSLDIADKGGAGHALGRPDGGDTITVVYSRVLAKTDFCSGWTGGPGGTPSFDLIGNKEAGATGNDTITVDQSSLNVTCTGGFHFGSIDLGATGSFVTTTVDFSKSKVALTTTQTTSTLVVTLGNVGRNGGTVGTVGASTTATYTPDPTLSDSQGNTIGTNVAKTPAEQQF
jgi:hypothetical protein